MSKYQITNPNNNIVRDYKSRTTESSVKGIGNTLGLVGLSISGYQLYNSKTWGQKIENGFDMLMGVAGFAGPVGAGISLYWGTIGKPLTRMHAKTITEQMKMGINPGLPAYQPFK
ncbi:MAG: hypothetical protein ACK5M0_05370 [Bacteroidales bacterium]